MTEQQVVFRACEACGKTYDRDYLYDAYAAVSLMINPSAVLVDDPAEIEFCPSCGQDFQRG